MEKMFIKFSQSGANNLLTLPNEELLFASRRHPYVVIVPIFIALLFLCTFIGMIFYAYSLFHIQVLLTLMSSILIFFATISIITKFLVDWSFHMYILTSGKIIELCYKPLYGEQINEVLLDQLRCTEIDVETNGILNQFLDMGNLIFTFDRPTHQQEFVFANMVSPRLVRRLLANSINDTKANVFSSHYVPVKREGEEKKSFNYVEEIFPRQSLEGNII